LFCFLQWCKLITGMYWNKRVQQGETEGEIANWKDTFMVIQCVEQVQQMWQRYTSIASRKHHEDHALRFNPCATHGFEVMQLIKRKKNLVYKNQGGEPICQKYKTKESTNRHNPMKKQNQTINKKKVKTLCK
jgi:hypothetical protein